MSSKLSEELEIEHIVSAQANAMRGRQSAISSLGQVDRDKWSYMFRFAGLGDQEELTFEEVQY